MNAQAAINAAIALMVFAFSAFILYVTRTQAGDLSVAGVALTGPPIGAVVAYFFHSQASAQGAAISTDGATTGAQAALGQPAAPRAAGGVA